MFHVKVAVGLWVPARVSPERTSNLQCGLSVGLVFTPTLHKPYILPMWPVHNLFMNDLRCLGYLSISSNSNVCFTSLPSSSLTVRYGNFRHFVMGKSSNQSFKGAICSIGI